MTDWIQLPSGTFVQIGRATHVEWFDHHASPGLTLDEARTQGEVCPAGVVMFPSAEGHLGTTIYGADVDAVRAWLSERAATAASPLHSTAEERAAHAVSIEVERNSRGYTYSVTCRGDDDQETLARVRSLMADLRSTYGPEPEAETP